MALLLCFRIIFFFCLCIFFCDFWPSAEVRFFFFIFVSSPTNVHVYAQCSHICSVKSFAILWMCVTFVYLASCRCCQLPMQYQTVTVYIKFFGRVCSVFSDISYVVCFFFVRYVILMLCYQHSRILSRNTQAGYKLVGDGNLAYIIHTSRCRDEANERYLYLLRGRKSYNKHFTVLETDGHDEAHTF